MFHSFSYSSTSAEDMENKYTLAISATLQAMKFFMMTVSSTEFSNLKDAYMEVIVENKFWKYSKNKEPQVSHWKQPLLLD